MPITSRAASRSCTSILSSAVLGQSHLRIGPSCRHTYATAPQLQQKDAPPVQPRSKIVSKAPKLSSSGLKSNLKEQQLQKNLEANKAIQKKYENDIAGASRHMENLSRQSGGRDMWARAQMAALDVDIPVTNSNIWGIRQLTSLWDNKMNNWKSALSMYNIASEEAFPAQYSHPDFPYEAGVVPPPSTAPPGHKIRFWKPLQIRHFMDFRSTRDDAWIGGIRAISSSLYEEMCRAIANNDKAVLKRVTSQEHLQRVMDIIKNRDPSVAYRWQFHGENTPCQVVSIRAGQAYTAKAPPPRGCNRMLINALVKFDTMQSLEVINRQGKRNVETPTPKRVLEYMIVEKRGWTTSPWTIRDKVYDTSGANYSAN